jgi:hypothetical protein
VAVPGELQRSVQVLGDQVETGLGAVEPGFDSTELRSDVVPFALEEVEKDSFGVVGVEQLLPLGDQTLLLGRQFRGLCCARRRDLSSVRGALHGYDQSAVPRSTTHSAIWPVTEAMRSYSWS